MLGGIMAVNKLLTKKCLYKINISYNLYESYRPVNITKYLHKFMSIVLFNNFITTRMNKQYLKHIKSSSK